MIFDFSIMDLYSQNILDYYRNPRNFGTIKGPSVSFQATNPFCGDSITFDLQINRGKVQSAKFRGEGCAISLAAASILTEHIIGKNIADILKLTFDDMQNFLGISVTQRRMKCSLLGLFALQNGILTHEKKETKKWSEM